MPSSAAHGDKLRRRAPSRIPLGSLIPVQFPLSRYRPGCLCENPCVPRMWAIKGLSFPHRPNRARRATAKRCIRPVAWLIIETFTKNIG